jgi:iron complex outermembrane receptor protein
VTRTGASAKGLQVEAQGGSLGTRGAAASFGRLFGAGRELLIAGSTFRSAGQASLYYPEFETSEAGTGMSIDLDDEEASTMFGSLSAGRFSIRGGVAHRHKQVPTASYSTVFGDDREATTDQRAHINAVYDGPIGHGWLATAQMGYDYYGYRGAYPYLDDDGGLVTDGNNVHAMTGEVTARRRVARVHLFTAGIEVRRQIHNRQFAADLSGETLNMNAPGTSVGLYAQDEVRIFPWLLANLGVRLDRLPAFGFHATPRAGLVFLPREQTAIKLLYGRAFRAPNAYEQSYFPANVGLPLGPEEMRSSEIVWEELVSKHVRTAVTAFAYDADQIIGQQRLDGGTTNDLYFANIGAIRGVGIEAELDTKLSNGISARFSQTFARVRDQVTMAPVSNSPSHLSKLGVQIPVSRLFVSVEGQYVGERLTLGGETLDGFFASNIVLTSPAGRRIGFTLGVYNAFNQTYADPGAEEHLQPSIRQDGRTVLVRVRAGF